MRSIITLITLSTLSAGCIDLEGLKGIGDPDSGEDTAGGEDTDSGEDTAGGEDTAVPTGTAEIRFLSLSATVTLHADAQRGADAVERALTPFSGSAFQEVAAGAYDLYATNDGGELVRSEGVILADGGHYSVAYTPSGALLVTETGEGDLPENHTRITYINLQADSSVTGDLSYYDYTSAAWTDPSQIFTLATQESFTDDFAFITTAAQLDLQFEGLDDLVVNWNTAAFMQIGVGTSINVYFWNEGDCSYGSTTCSPMILGQLADGTTATVAHITEPGYEWSR